ncbi:MAG: hypothetical protein HY243_17795 [Proteobacteria bacterium]|nr:hypothetical protein [Pseudomonadota bacterium]
MPVENSSDPNLANYAVAGFLAFCGAFLRAARWRDERTGRVRWWKLATEIPVAIAFGAVAVGLGAYYQLSAPVYGGLAGLLGLLGPSGLEAFLAILKIRIGGER